MDVKFPKNIVLKGLLIEDLHQDTLLFTETFQININNYTLNRNRFYINSIQLDQPVVKIKYYQKETLSNLQFILDYFEDTTSNSTNVKPSIYLKIGLFKITDGRVIYQNQHIVAKGMKSINYDDLHITHFNYTSDYFTYYNNELRTKLKRLSLMEKSGFIISQLSTDFKMTPTEMEFSKLDLITPRSHIRDYYLMRYKDISDMGDYLTKVYMNSNFVNSKIAYKDVAYFTDELANYTGTVYANGKVYGTVDDLSSDEITIKTNDTTYCEGKFSIKGMPDMEHAELYFKADKLISNLADAKKLLINVDQKEISSLLPNELDRLGTFSFSGYYQGRINDFNLKGQMQSAIGGIYADFNMKLPDNQVASYKGEIQTIDFDLGHLIAQENIGICNIKANLDGQGFSLAELKTKFDASILDIHLNNYTYRNLNTNGEIDQKVLNAAVHSNETALHFDLDGKVDLKNLELPAFQLAANIKRIDLLALHFTTDSFVISSK